MNNLFVNCNHCGTSLQIEDEIMFTTCRSCGSTLEIVRTFNSVYTKVKNIEKEDFIETREELLHEKLAKLSSKPITTFNKRSKDYIYKEIELLDREWENKLPTFMTKGSLPSENNFFYIVVSIGMIIFIVFWMIGSNFTPFYFFGLFGIAIVVFNLISSINKQQNYKNAKAKYERQRTQLLNQLNQ